MSWRRTGRSEEHTSELQSPCNLVCRLLLEKKKKKKADIADHRRDHVRGGGGVSSLDCVHGDLCCSVLQLLGQRDLVLVLYSFFFFNDTATTEIYTLSLHDALPIWSAPILRTTGGPSATNRSPRI